MDEPITPVKLAEECRVDKKTLLDTARKVLNFANVFTQGHGAHPLYIFNKVQAEKIRMAIKGGKRVKEQVDVIPITVGDAPEREDTFVTGAKVSNAVAKTGECELFDVPQVEKTMTTKEVADVLGVDVKTVQRAAEVLFDSTVEKVSYGGRPTMVFTEEQATAIKQEIQKHHNLPSRQIDNVTTELEENETILHAVSILQRRSEEYKKRAEVAEARNATLEPKGDAYDALMSGDGTYSIKEAAKMLRIKGVGQNNLFKILRERKYLMASNLPYQQYVEQGLFVVKAITVPIKGRDVNMTITRVTPKGLDWLRKDLGDVA